MPCVAQVLKRRLAPQLRCPCRPIAPQAPPPCSPPHPHVHVLQPLPCHATPVPCLPLPPPRGHQQVKLLKCLVDNIVVDISFFQVCVGGRAPSTREKRALQHS